MISRISPQLTSCIPWSSFCFVQAVKTVLLNCDVLSWTYCYIWAPSSEFVSSSIPSWQILTAHAQPFRGTSDLGFCLKVPLYSLLVWASSGGSGETARMRRLAWTFAARNCDKYQIRLTRSISSWDMSSIMLKLSFLYQLQLVMHRFTVNTIATSEFRRTYKEGIWW